MNIPLVNKGFAADCPKMDFPAIRGVYTQLNSQTEFAAVTSPIDSSNVFPLSAKAAAERCNASPIPAEVMAKLFPQNCYYFYFINKNDQVISA